MKQHYRDLAFRCLTIRRLPKPSPPTSGSPPTSAAWRTPPKFHREQGPGHRSVSLLPDASFSSEFPPLLRRSTTALRSESLLALLPTTPPPLSTKSKRKRKPSSSSDPANSAREIPVPPRPARGARGSAPAAAASHGRKARFAGSTPPRSAASKIQGRQDQPAASFSVNRQRDASFFRLLRRPFSTGTPPPPPPAAAQPPCTSTSSKRRRRRRNKQSAANSPASGRPIGQALPPAGGPGGSAAVSARGQAPAGSSSPLGPQKRKRLASGSSPPSRPPPTPMPADLSAAESTCERYYYAAGKRVRVAKSKSAKAAREREYLEWYSSGNSRFVFGGVIDSFYIPEILHQFRLQTEEEIQSWKLRVNAISFPPAHPGFRQPRKAHIAAKFGRFVVHHGRKRPGSNERTHHLMVVSFHDPRIVYSIADFGRAFYDDYLSAMHFYEYWHSWLYPEYSTGHKKFGPWQKM